MALKTSCPGLPDTPDPGRIGKAPVDFSYYLLLVLLGTALIAATACAFMFASSRTTDRAEIERLRDENQAQQFHIQGFADKVGRISAQMEKMNNYYTRLKILTQMDPQVQAEPGTAAGGPQPGENEMDVYLEKNLKKQIRMLHWEMEELQMEAQIQEETAHRIEDFFDSQTSLMAATPTIWPVRGWVSSSFGRRISPFTGMPQRHEGIDIGADTGTAVRATADGIVILAGWEGEYGKTLVIDHGYGYKTRFGHLSTILVREGQRIKRGHLLGSVGNTGRSTGPHLHYEVRLRNIPVNPKSYLLN